MKPTSKTKATLFVISKISMIAATIISSRSVGTRFKAIRTLALVTLFGAGVVANTNADRHGAGLHVVRSPFISNSSLDAAVIIADNDIWAVGFIGAGSGPFQTLAEHFDGTSWSIVSSPAFSGVSGLTGVSADSSTDVWAGGDLTWGGPTSLHWHGQAGSQIPTAPLRFAA